MRKGTLTRQPSSVEGTFGKLVLDDGWECVTGELPDDNNLPDFSCIPDGTYQCMLAFSPHFNTSLFHLRGVPNRSSVEIHAGNWCGDKRQGFRSDVEGCIILGKTTGTLDNQKAILASKAALEEFMRNIGNDVCELTIEWGNAG